MPPKKEDKPATDHFPSFLMFLFCLLFFGMLSMRLQWYFENTSFGSYQTLWARFVGFILGHVWPVIKFLGALLGVGSLMGAVYSIFKLRAIGAEEALIYHNAEDKGAESPASVRNDKWEKVLEHINSPHSADWRLAIIEADIILDELLESCGYHGSSIGEKLKAVERSDFLTLDNAWEAHKVRNEIAHAGSDFDLNERDAQRVINLYESVFKEFKMI